MSQQGKGTRSLLRLALGSLVLCSALSAEPAAAVAPAATSDETTAIMPLGEDAKAADSLYRAAIVLYESGKFVDAARLFISAAEKAPKESALLYNAAKAFDKAGDSKLAIEWYRKFLTNNPTKREGAIATARLQVIEREVVELSGAGRPLPPSLPYVEQVTKHTFQTLQSYDGKPYTLMGVGARKVMGFKVYAMALYVEDEGARAAFPKLAAQAGGADRDSLLHSDLAYKFIVLGDFGKSAIMHFVRAVSASDSRKAYREAFAGLSSGGAPSDLQRDIEAFVNLFDDIAAGEDLLIRTTADGQISVESHGQKRLGPKNLRLSHDIWDLWLGSKPISSDLKKTILDRVDTLGR
jgi:tetratricopeptide (TPR) repeat protein